MLDISQMSDICESNEELVDISDLVSEITWTGWALNVFVITWRRVSTVCEPLGVASILGHYENLDAALPDGVILDRGQ